MTTPTSVDVIERTVVIAAGIDRVWDLVSCAGFWVGEQLQFGHRAGPGETVEVDSGKWGTFPVRVEVLEPPDRAVYRWASGYPGQAITPQNSTLVEITLEPTTDGVLVRIRESGFAGLEGSDDFRMAQYSANVDGWAQQGDALRAIAEAEHP